ncbi:MAG TPA: UDP-N-acetylglucosamine 2-epimerase (non-hydrolyzing) [Acidimicrobiales bacterium]
MGVSLTRVLCVFGTRPESIKMAPVVAELGARPGVDCSVAVTAQHREMLDDVLDLFGILPDHDLDLMTAGQTPSQVTARILGEIDDLLAKSDPDWVVVQGDTTTAMAAGLGAFHARVRVAHVEAGLRTHDRTQPFPEEVNRRVVSMVTDLHFAPTDAARANLLAEGVDERDVIVTGNPVVDAFVDIASRPFDTAGTPLAEVPLGDGRLVVLTAHRRETLGAPMREALAAARALVERHDDVRIVYPVHPNPRVRAVAYEVLDGIDRVHLVPPLDYRCFVGLLSRAHLVLTDSGGVQEEAPSVGVPVLVLRDTTERPEAVEAGTARLVGTSATKIVTAASRLLGDRAAYDAMARASNPYGDGHARVRIADALERRP